jgi:iron complex outermembrane receptor protein
MPLTTRISLQQKNDTHANVIEVQFVDRKSQIDTQRFELKAAGYILLNWRTAYRLQKARLDFSITNFFHKFCYLLRGGVDIADWKANGATGHIGSIADNDRSINVGMNVDF